MSTASPSSHSCVFDIETAGLDPDYLDMIAPEFKPDARLKDPDKIIANLAEQKQKWVERAALSPMTGKVLCIGIRDLDGSFSIMDGGGDEKQLLEEWREFYIKNHKEQFIGFNTTLFDGPFLIKRAWKLGVKPFLRPGVKLNRLEDWTDLREVWQLGDRQAEGSLDAIAKFFGVGVKTGSGADFSRLWSEDREAATAYLKNDIEITAAIAERMGVLC